MRLRAALCLLLGLAALASGCGGSSEETSTAASTPAAGAGGTLTFAVPSLPRTLDPLAAGNRTALLVARQAYEPLVERLTGPYGRPGATPGLAMTVAASADRSVWTFTLRPGVRFQDGTPFNAAAVLANARRWASQPGGRRLLPHLFAVDAPRPDQVRFLLARAVPDLLRRLSDPRLGIVSPRGLEPQSGRSARFRAETVGSGTGPFLPRVRNRGRLELSRYAGWWGSPLGLGPALDGAAFLAVTDPAGRLRSLERGQSQVAEALPGLQLRAAEQDPLLVTLRQRGGGIALSASVRGIGSALALPQLSSVWLTDIER